MAPSLHVVVLAAGEGTRLKGRQTKVLMPLWGRPAVAWPVDAALCLGPEKVVVVGGQHLAALKTGLEGRSVEFALQEQPLGTGHAVSAAQPAFEPEGGAPSSGELLVINGDCPLVTAELLEQLVAAHRAHPGPVSFLSMELDDPTGYGRVLRDELGRVTAIVEEKDADPDQQAVCEVNAGIWVLELPDVWKALARIGSDNKAREVYLTDLVSMAVAAGESVTALCWGWPEDVLGFNDQSQLAEVRTILQHRILAGHMKAGVEIVDPETTFIDADVQIEAGARILPCTMIEGRVSIAQGCDVGPFAHLRDGSVLQAGSKVGNFTETKQSTLGPGVKAGHLTYLGNAEVGANTNIGAGTITANYDGTHKHQTRIGERVFIGSGTVLVAPADVGDDALTGAGAIVPANKKIGAGEVWVGLPAKLHRSAPSSDRQEQEPPS